MKAVILAAGLGTRLRPLTQNVPKCLLGIDTETILDHQINMLYWCGISDIVVVAGYYADQIMEHCRDRANAVINHRYRETNSIYSFWLVRELFQEEDFLVLNGDVLFNDWIRFKKFVFSEYGNALLVSSNAECQDNEMNVMIKDDLILRMGKDILGKEADAESKQVAKFCAKDAKILFNNCDDIIQSGRLDGFPTQAFDVLIEQEKFNSYEWGESAWFEIDTVGHLHAARRFFRQHLVSI